MLVFLDCDPGIDDALAIGYLLAHPDGVRIIFDIAEPFAPQLLARLLSL